MHIVVDGIKKYPETQLVHVFWSVMQVLHGLIQRTHVKVANCGTYPEGQVAEQVF